MQKLIFRIDLSAISSKAVVTLSKNWIICIFHVFVLHSNAASVTCIRKRYTTHSGDQISQHTLLQNLLPHSMAILRHWKRRTIVITPQRHNLATTAVYAISRIPCVSPRGLATSKNILFSSPTETYLRSICSTSSFATDIRRFLSTGCSIAWRLLRNTSTRIGGCTSSSASCQLPRPVSHRVFA